MGYTIYVNLPKYNVKNRTVSNVRRWKATCELIKLAWKKIPEHYTDNAEVDYHFIGFGNGAGTCTPEITDSYICFNGKCPDDYVMPLSRWRGLTHSARLIATDIQWR